MRIVIAFVLLPGCYAGIDARPVDDGEASSETAPPARDSPAIGEPDDTSSSGADETAGLAADDYDCVGTLVLEQLGEVLAVAPDASAVELSPLQPGEGFTCMRVELELEAAALAPTDDVCPVYVALASIRGTAPGGEDLAAAFVHAFDGDAASCTRGADRLAIGNFRELTDEVPAQRLSDRVRMRVLVQPFVSRIELFVDDVPFASASADLFPASVADTRDPVVRLGLPRAANGTITPWYGARYRDLRVFAEVVPP